MDDFHIVRVIGKGYMGKVMVVRHKLSGQVYAIKSIHKQAILERREVSHTRSERDILADLVSHQGDRVGEECPFLIYLHAAFQDRANVYYVMDFYGGGDMAGLLARFVRFPEQWARLYAAQIALGLRELHARGIVYRDLKPENILIAQDGHLVLTDFGLSKHLETDELTDTFCGTPEYLAPEVVLKKRYGKEVDWWGFGVLLHEMLAGMTPFWADTPAQMYSKIVSEQRLAFPRTISAAAQDLLSGLLIKDPGRRIGVQDIFDHPFFAGLDWHKVASLQYAAPRLPHYNSMLDVDVNAFDPMFTSMPPIITPEDSSFLAENSMAQKVFQGFSFRR